MGPGQVVLAILRAVGLFIFIVVILVVLGAAAGGAGLAAVAAVFVLTLEVVFAGPARFALAATIAPHVRKSLVTLAHLRRPIQMRPKSARE